MGSLLPPGAAYGFASVVALLLLSALAAPAQTVPLQDVLTLPASAGSPPLARLNVMREVPDGSGRLFVNDLRGPLHVIDGGSVQEYVDLADVFLDFRTTPGLATGFVSFAFDPEFATNGLFYTVHTETPGGVAPNFGPALPIAIVQHSVLTEWTADVPSASTFSGSRREVLRIASPHEFHNLGEIAFDPWATSGDPDYRLLYVGAGDFGSVWLGDPAQLQRLDTLYGTILRIDPRGAGHHDYAIPVGNPFVDGDPATFDEIYAYGFRNAHRLAWDPVSGNLYAMDIGEDNAEEIDLVTPGTNYGWPYREGNKRLDPFTDPGTVFDLSAQDLQDDATHGYVYPVAWYDHGAGTAAIAGGYPVRNVGFPALDGRFVFGDIASGLLWSAEIAALEAADDGDPATMAPFTPVSLEVEGVPTTLLDEVRDASGSPGLSRTDLRLGIDRVGRLYVTTKQDGVLRALPEPGAWLGLLAGSALLTALRRRAPAQAAASEA